MEVLLLGEKCTPYLSIFSENLDESWKISTWKPEEGSDILVKKYKSAEIIVTGFDAMNTCLLYTSPSPRDMRRSRMPSSA